MKKYLQGAAVAALSVAIAAPVMADEWSVSVWGKPRVFTSHIEKLNELLTEKTNGEFTLNISYGGLSKAPENLDGISIGAFEMAQICAGYHRDKNPALTVLELPFIGVNTLEQEVAVSMAVYGTEAAKADMDRWNAMLLMPSPMPQYNLVGKGDAPKTLDDFQGMRVRATGGIGQAFTKVGAVPTSVTATEAYNAMESGVVDSVAFAQHAHQAYRTIDMGTYWTTNLNPGTVNCPVVMSKDAYDALSDEHKEALNSSVQEALDHYLAEYTKVYDKFNAALDEKGIERVTYSEDDLAAFREAAAAPIREEWIKDMSAQGIAAQELIDTMMGALNASN
ncbi:TRAP transporter substrate-binding protein DctP [Pseudooceanicola sp. MF1-13]|uniref:TRAP transporter substrate-binding protein DctP n=1 Tax=Pseudooceanicola sp. MF1-13 TaxID=3379095 RepID=UPI003891D93E